MLSRARTSPNRRKLTVGGGPSRTRGQLIVDLRAEAAFLGPRGTIVGLDCAAACGSAAPWQGKVGRFEPLEIWFTSWGDLVCLEICVTVPMLCLCLRLCFSAPPHGVTCDRGRLEKRGNGISGSSEETETGRFFLALWTYLLEGRRVTHIAVASGARCHAEHEVCLGTLRAARRHSLCARRDVPRTGE